MLRLLTGNVTRALSCTNFCSIAATTQRVFGQRFISSALGQNKLNLLAGSNFTLSRWLSPVSVSNGSVQSGAVSAEFRPPVRTVTKFSLIKGKRKSVKAVLKRFKRLDWGAWIRTHSGRHKKLFKKSPALKRRLRQHVFTNATQSWLLDKMVTSFWRRPKHYIDDPYEPYHKRDEYFTTKSKTFKI